LAEVGDAGVQLLSAIGVGPVVSGAGHVIVTQLFELEAVCGVQLPGGTPIVSEDGVQVVVVFPLPGPAADGVQDATFCGVPLVVWHVVMTQFVFAPPPGVHEATTVGPVVAVRQLTNVGPVVLGEQLEVGTSVKTTGLQVVVTAPTVPAVQFAGSTGVAASVWRSRQAVEV
jgi:hypothetical protein